MSEHLGRPSLALITVACELHELHKHNLTCSKERLELVTISTKSYMISVTNCLITDLETAQMITNDILILHYKDSSFRYLNTLFPS